MKIIKFLLSVVFVIYCSASLAHELKSFAPIVKNTLPAVVSIRAKTAPIEKQKLFENMEVPKEMEKFFEEFFNQQLPNDSNKKPNISQGSGFIFDKKGYVLTNHHVIYHASNVEVVMQDGTTYQAKVKGVDPLTDIAVLKIKNFKKPLPIIKFGNSDNSEVGDWVIAIGNPLGLGGTVTKGIISARGRNIQSGLYDDYIQTDTPINRGNSGGPLINTQGDVIGVNTVIISPTGGSIGLSFAISGNLVKNVAKQLVNKGTVSRAWLGVSLKPVTSEIADSLSLKKVEGVIISGVQKDSPADKGGVKIGDIILSVDDKIITKTNRLPMLIAISPLNRAVNLKIIRAGKIKNLKVKLVKREEKTAFITQPNKPQISKAKELPKIEVLVNKLNDYYRNKYRYNKDTKGVVITAIAKSSSAYGVLREGMIISQVNSVAIENIEDAVKVISLAVKQKKKNILLVVESNNSVQQLITIPLD